MNVLEKIIKDKKEEIDNRKRNFPIKNFDLKNNFPERFLQSLNKKPIGFIAEIKRKSPSAGVIRKSFDITKIVSDYEQNGATIISCLMDKKYFGGGEDDFMAVCQNTSLPILYKEFVIDEWQIKHANHIGASGILLIVSALDKKELNELFHCAIENNLTPLIEVHDEIEMEIAIDLGAKCIGINNRNLKTFETSLDVTKNLLRQRPTDIFVVSESGIKTSEDVYELSSLGVNALLVGEQLLKAESPGKELRSLLSKL
jgi:indole-3-glycerol phosphate synthase